MLRYADMKINPRSSWALAEYAELGRRIWERLDKVMPRKARVTSATPETKAERSVRLANQRVGQALKYLNLVGNLSGPGYEFTSVQRTQIVKTLTDATQGVTDRFQGKTLSASGFRLGS